LLNAQFFLIIPLFAQLSKVMEPNSYLEVTAHPKWQVTMRLELKALQHNDTWFLTQLPASKTLIGCCWVYKITHHSNGSIERYKA
jgi:hypothetical protein